MKEKLVLGRTLSTRKAVRLETIRTLYEQQQYMYDHHCQTVPERIVPSWISKYIWRKSLAHFDINLLIQMHIHK